MTEIALRTTRPPDLVRDIVLAVLSALIAGLAKAASLA